MKNNKRVLKLCALLCAAACLFASGFSAAARESGTEAGAPDLSLTEGKLTYSAAGGLRLTASADDYDPRDPVPADYGVRLPVTKGEIFAVSIYNQTERIAIRVQPTVVTETGRVDCEAIKLSGGQNTLTFSATGAVTAIELTTNGFLYAGGVWIVSKIEAAGKTVWTPERDNWQAIESPAVAAEIGLAAANTLTGAGLEKNVWYPILFSPGTLAGNEGFSFRVDTTAAGKAEYFNKYVQEFDGDNVGEQWYAPDDGVFYCHPDSGQPFAASGNLVPANFVGTIVVAFSSFRKPDWANPGNDVLDLENTDNRIGFTFDGNRGDFAFGLSDFKPVRTVEVVETAAKTQGDIRFIDDMSGYADSVDASLLWKTNWTLASPCDLTLVDNPSPTVGASGKLLRIVPQPKPASPQPDPSTGMTQATGFTALEHFPGKFDITDTVGLTFFIKNESAAPLYFSFEFDILQDDVRQRWAVKQYGRYILYDTQTGTQKLYNSIRGLYIPADFCGFVRIAYTQFTNPSWETVNGSFTTLNGLVYFVINIDTQMFALRSFLFGALGVYGTETQISTPFHEAEHDIESAIRGEA